MYLIVSIDVEEDNWGEYDPLDYSVENLRKVPGLQDIFDRFEITPTYLVNYPVASDPWAVEMFSRYAELGRCEIGMHCHPWNTPPFSDTAHQGDSMLCNLPAGVQFEKLNFLHETIRKNIGVAPVSFRAGRWGFGPETAAVLDRLGYKVDTSVTPFVSWKGLGGPDYTDFGLAPFRFRCDDIAQANEKGPLLQVPATVGFLQSSYSLCRLMKKMAENRIGRMIHLKGILYRCGFLNQAWLSPELSDVRTMIRLAQRIEKLNYPCLNMTFHSSSLKEGLSPFVGIGEEARFLEKIKAFLSFARQSGYASVSLKEFAQRYSCAIEIDRSGAARSGAGGRNAHPQAANE